MFFYKHLDENGNVSQIESRNAQAINAPETMVEIAENEYQSLMGIFIQNVEKRPIEESELYQKGYEQALLDMAEVGV